MLFSFPPPRCEPGEALLSQTQTSSRPFYHCLDLDECGRRNKRAAASRKRGASPSSDGPRRPDTLSFVRAPGSAGAAPRAYAGPAPRSHLLTVRDGLGRRGRDRGGKKRRASQVRPASLDTPRLPRRAPAHLPWSRACLGCRSGFHRQVPCFLPLNSSPSAKSCHLHVSIRLAYSNVRGTSLAPEPS